MTTPFEHFHSLQNQRAAALRPFGFTERDASFLALVMVHGGVCVKRQYGDFSDRSWGNVPHHFFAALVNEHWATAHPCGRRGAHLVHISHKKLYRAIGQVDNRNRRPPTAARAVERLMLLDAVLAHRESLWLGTERDKVAYCVEHRGLDLAHLPSVTFTTAGGRTVRYFPEKMPIGIAADGRVTFLYVASDPLAQEFRQFVDRLRPLFGRVLPWRMLIVLPRALSASEPAHRAVIKEQLQPALRPAVVDEFRWYCEARLRLERSPAAVQTLDAARFQRARRAFGAPRFFAAYRAWKEHGDASLHQLLSPVLHEAAVRGDARVDTWIVPHTYTHLDGIAQTA
jgi:hypothetical protein